MRSTHGSLDGNDFREIKPCMGGDYHDAPEYSQADEEDRDAVCLSYVDADEEESVPPGPTLAAKL